MGSTKTSRGFFARNRSVFVLGLSALIIAATADLFAGLFLKSMEAYILAVPGMMVLIYSAIGMRGNIYGAMGSRLGTSMHMGTFRMSFAKGGILRNNMEATLALTLVLSISMGIIGWVIVRFFFQGDIDPLGFIFISTAGGLLAGLVVMVFNIIIAFEGYKHDWDVDNITAPLIAAVGDIVTVPMIFLSTWLFLHWDPLLTDACCLVLIAFTFVVIARIIRRKKSRKGRMDESKRIVVQSIPVLIVCLFFEIGAGIVIQGQEARLLEFAVLMIMMPAFLNEGNALSGMLTSRLSSMLHLGTLRVQPLPPREAYENFGIMYIMAFVTFVIIGVAAYMVSGSDNVSFLATMFIVVAAGMVTTTVLNFLSYYVAILAVRFNLDPDDHSIPVTSSIMDLAGSMIMIAVVLAVL
ncbi:MAG: magnesium transporter [Candidatus Methanomethylophilaceae archaeon]|jgi:mgtE-like transporter|nr:magnesium transporter [Candidatus Methanomethylophilaceae archaeon]NLF33811.1 Mg/Co/Ni transporter MgtE [Thermoplasmatales archaeon]